MTDYNARKAREEADRAEDEAKQARQELEGVRNELKKTREDINKGGRAQDPKEASTADILQGNYDK